MGAVIGTVAVAIIVVFILLILWLKQDSYADCQGLERYSNPGSRAAGYIVNACFKY